MPLSLAKVTGPVAPVPTMIKVKRTEVDDLVLTVNLEFLARKGLDTPLGVGVTIGLICGDNIFSQLRHHLSKIIISGIELGLKYHLINYILIHQTLLYQFLILIIASETCCIL